MVVKAALGICAVVGVTLNTSAYQLWVDSRGECEEATLQAFISVAPFATMRFFLVPFCVASYSGVISQESKLGTFTWLFPSRNQDGIQLIHGVNDSVSNYKKYCLPRDADQTHGLIMQPCTYIYICAGHIYIYMLM